MTLALGSHSLAHIAYHRPRGSTRTLLSGGQGPTVYVDVAAPDHSQRGLWKVPVGADGPLQYRPGHVEAPDLFRPEVRMACIDLQGHP
jgi:hypothetical protein